MNNSKQSKQIDDLLNSADENQLIADLATDKSVRASSVAKAKKYRKEAERLGAEPETGAEENGGAREDKDGHPEGDRSKSKLSHLAQRTATALIGFT